MRSTLLAAALVLGCDSASDPGTTTPTSSGNMVSYRLEIAPPGTSLTFMGPAAVSNGIVFQIGESLIPGKTGPALMALRPESEVLFAKHVDAALYDVVADGAGGAIVVGGLFSAVRGVFVGRIDRAGAWTWAREVHDASLPVPVVNAFARPGLSSVANDKLALLVSRSVIVLDARTGAALLRRELPHETKQALVDATGITVIGNDVNEMIVTRLDLSGAVQWTRASSTAVPAGWAFGRPLARGNGALVSYMHKDAPLRIVSYGVLALAADGALRAQWTHQTSTRGSFGDVSFDLSLEREPMELMPYGAAIWVNAPMGELFKGTRTPRHVGFAINDTGEWQKRVHYSTGRTYAIGDVIASFDAGYVYVGDPSASCNPGAANIEQITRADAAKPALTLTATTADVAVDKPIASDAVTVTLDDLGAAKISERKDCSTR